MASRPMRMDRRGLHAMNAMAIVLLLLSWTSSTPARAQDPRTGGELQTYRVEILIFEMPGASRRPEDPGPPPLPPEPELLVFDLIPDGDEEPAPVEEPAPLEEPGQDEVTAAGEPALDPASFFFEPLEREDLLSMAGKLGRRSGYRVLYHEAWHQPGFPRDDAMTLDLDTVGRVRARIEYEEALAQGLRPPAPEPEMPAVVSPDGQGGDSLPQAETLSATARLWRGRYLHLDIETVLTRNTLTMRLSESRRMRSGELHYLDSPGIGAIAVIIPYEHASEEEDGQSGQTLSGVPTT